jgi:hypothetical protein
MAALDFPNAPSIGQVFLGPGGIQWMWDGIKWAAVGGATAPTFDDIGRNKLHNGMFSIQQHGQGPWTELGVYTADRWLLSLANDTASVTLVGTSDTDRSQIGDEEAGAYLQNVFTGSATAGSNNVIAQRIEFVRRLSGKIVTVSFWAKASSGAPALGVGCQQYFGSGGSPSAIVYVVGASTGALTNTWTRYSQQLTLPSAAGKTFGTSGNNYTQLDIWYSCATNGTADAPPIGRQSGTVQIWGVQLEVADAVTPLEKPDNDFEVARCERFFFVAQTSLGGYGDTGAYMFSPILFPGTMRASPTVTTTAIYSLVNCSAPTYAGYAGAAGVQMLTVVTVAGTFLLNIVYTADADL